MSQSKHDAELGQRVHQFLLEQNLESNINFDIVNSDNADKISTAWTSLLLSLGFPFSAVGSQANRLTDFYLNDRFSGLNYDNFPRITPLPNSQNYKEPLIARNIEFISTCEHHLVPINGIANIAYCPQGSIVGLNKLNLVLDFFAKRPQLQESLTRQVLHVLKFVLKTNDVAIVIKAKHNCMSLECVDNSTEHLTFEFSGIFATDVSYKNLLLSNF